MKRHCLWIGMFLLLVFPSCHSPQREARHMVARAERLFDTLPDSTASLIDSVLRMPVYFNEKRRMDMALLQAEALLGDRGQEIPPLMDDDFFDDKPFFSTSPELERAAEYYAKKKKYAKAAHAALYSGFVQQHYNDKAAAMLSFKEAERYGGMVGDSLAVARAEYKMGKMLLDDGAEQESLPILQTSELGFGNHFADKALVQNIMAVCCMLFGEYNNAAIHLQNSLDFAEKASSEKVKRKVFNNYAVLYQMKNEYEKAIDYLKQLEIISDSSRLPLLYLNLGDAFLTFGQIDSASFYYNQLENTLPNSELKAETQLAAYGALSRFAKRQGDNSLALQYREMHENLLYELMWQRQKQNIYRIQQQYDYENLQNTMNRRLVHKQRIITIGIVLILGIVALFLYRSALRNKKEAEINANLFHFMQQNKELIQHNAEHEKRYLDQTQHLSNLLTDKFHAMQKLDCYLKGQGDKIILKDLEKSLFEGKNHLVAIMELLDELYPDLNETLKTKYPEMSDLERQVYILSRYKLPRIEEASLLGISTSVLDKARGKVRKMMENDQ